MQGTPRRQTRAGRGAAKPGGSATLPRRPVVNRPTTVELIERVVALQLRQAPLETLANELLSPLLDAFEAPAGGLLLYHVEDESLRLLASRRLSAAGMHSLAKLHRGAAEAWEIPLHGLLNRKAYIIERPDKHPFVPELVVRDDLPQLMNLASIPLYRGGFPVGVLLAITDRRPITEHEILNHVLVFDVLALALESAARPRMEAVVSDDAPRPSLLCEPWVDPLEVARELEAKLAAASSERQALADRLAEHEATLAEVRGDLEEERHDRGTVNMERAVAAATAERDRAHQAAAEAGEVVRELRAEIARLEAELGTARADLTQGQRRASTTVEQAHALSAELVQLRSELAHLRDERARVVAASGDPAAEPAVVVEAMRARAAGLEQQLRTLAAERAEQERALAAVRVEHQARLDTLQAVHRAEVAELRATHEREVDELKAHDTGQLTRATETNELRAAEIQRLSASVEELEQRLQWALAEREEIASAASAREHAAIERLEAERETAAAGRTALDERLAAAEAARAAETVRVTALRQEIEGRDERLQAAARRLELLEAELRTVRGEAARLREDRERVLAAVEDPEAEPATVIRALREAVAGLEGQVGALTNEVATLSDERARLSQRLADGAQTLDQERERQRQEIEAAHAEHARAVDEIRARYTAEVEQAGARHAQALEEVRAAGARELAAVRGTSVQEIGALRAAVDRLEAEQRGALERAEADRCAAAAEIGELRAALAERDTQIAERAAALAERNAAVAERDALLTERETLLAQRDSALSEREQALAALGAERELVQQSGVQAGDLVRQLRDETTRLRTENATLGERVASLERTQQTLEQDRTTIEREHATQAARVAYLEAEIARREDLVTAAASRATELEVEVGRLRIGAAELRLERAHSVGRGESEEREATPATSAAHDLAAAAAAAAAAAGRDLRGPDPVPPPLRVDVLRVLDRGSSDHGTVEHGGAPVSHRVIDPDPVRRQQIAATVDVAVQAKSLMLVNLLALAPTNLGEVSCQATEGVTLIGYAADEEDRSRILGAIRCFGDPPSPIEATAALELLPRGARRLITLSDDIDAFIPAKAALTKAGHSVSMACDAKQALDLLAMLTPDAVLVDVRSAPEAAAEFLAALAPESGRVLVLLVHGFSGDALNRVLRRLLRPQPLDPADLVHVCETVLEGPAPSNIKDVPKPVRALERPKLAPRGKPVARRVLPRRR